jgi:hypothetical protein
MTAKLYTLNAHKANVLNLVPYHLTEHCPERWYGCCQISLEPSDPPVFTLTPGPLNIELYKKSSAGIRHFDWANNQDFLQDTIKLAEQHNQDLFLNSHSHNQLKFFKSVFGENAVVIALTYDHNDYDYILTDLAKTHVWLLSNNKINITEQDTELMLKLTHAELVEHYKLAFDNIQYIPESVKFEGDYEIPFRDYFDSDMMEKHFASIGFPITDRSKSLYHQWLERV